MITVTPVPRWWPGLTVACVAPGPGVTAEDVARIRGVWPVVSVNDAIQLAPWADVAYSSDLKWWARVEGLPAFAGIRYGLVANPNRAARTSGYEAWPAVRLLWNAGPHGLSLNPLALRHGHNSGYAAVNLAFLAGARRILLLGYSMGNSRDGRGYFWGGKTDASKYEKYLRAFETLAPELDGRAVEVVNLTEGSALRAFPRDTLARELSREFGGEHAGMPACS